MNSTPQPQVSDLLSDFHTEMNLLRKKFHAILKRYEANRIEHLKNLVSQIKSN